MFSLITKYSQNALSSRIGSTFDTGNIVMVLYCQYWTGLGYGPLKTLKSLGLLLVQGLFLENWHAWLEVNSNSTTPVCLGPHFNMTDFVCPFPPIPKTYG